jgi:hypothetical protein
MSSNITARLNQVLPKITDDAFLSSEGIGNEIACYIFDYPAEEEQCVREHIAMMLNRIASHHTGLRVLHLNLLDVVVAYLEKRRLLAKAIEMQETRGDQDVLRALKGPLAAEKLRDFIASEHKLAEYDLVLLSGVGSVWPMLRAHGLLNCLHTVMGQTPLVLFYPGTFDGTTLRLFGGIGTDISRPGTRAYYRAFLLVPGGTKA